MILYQLRVFKQIADEWDCLVWNSKLYVSKNACLFGCKFSEIEEITRVVYEHGEDTDAYYPSKVGKVEEKARRAFRDKVQTWLSGDEDKLFVEDPQSVTWMMCNFEVVRK